MRAIVTFSSSAAASSGWRRQCFWRSRDYVCGWWSGTPRPRAIPSCAVSALERWSCIGLPESKKRDRAAGENHFGVAIGDRLSGEYERVHLPLALARQNRLSPTTHYACDQDRMEPILLQRSTELGAQPFYGCTAVNVEQHESAVTADVVWSPSIVGTPAPARRADRRLSRAAFSYSWIVFCCAVYRAPWIWAFATAASIRCRSSGVSSTRSAPTFSSRRCTLVVRQCGYPT